jgi:PAS domain S-box-containing protein
MPVASFGNMHPTDPEEELRSGVQRLQILATTISGVVWYTAPDGSVMSANPSWEAFTGQTPAQYAGWGWADAIHPDDREQVMATWRGGLGQRAVIDLSYRLRRHDGVYRDVTARGGPLIQDGEVREWIGLSVDVTDSRQAEVALKESEDRFRFLDRLGQATRTLTDANELMAVTARMLGEYLGATRCAYADVDADSDHFTIRNDWALAGVPSSAGVYSLGLFGPQATSNLRQGRHLVVRDVDRELGDEGGGRMFNAIGIKAIVCAALVKEGRLVALMAVHQSVPRDWTGQEIGLIGQVVERSWAHIERVRDSALLKDQERRKDEFLATLAHELRNPLAPMKYAVAMVRMGADAASSAKAFDVIDRQVSVMARLVDDLLDLSRINQGLIHLKPERVGVAELMQKAVEAAGPAIAAARHRLRIERPPVALWLEADPARIVQVIGNLLTNAAKYTPDGGEIRLAARQEGDKAVIEVSDNGIGIPKEEQGKLFQMFTQLSHTSARAQGGLGIGLSLVKTLLTMHGGSVRVHSDGIGLGSRFTLDLPLAQAPAGAAPVDGQDPVTAEAGTRIMVVEDNADGLETLLALLDAMGYTAAGAADGPAGLELARRFGPDLILLDLGLPGMDGYDVVRALRADPAFAATHITALTGWGAERDRQRTAEAGFNDHLTKPIEPVALEQYLAQFSRAAAAGT